MLNLSRPVIWIAAGLVVLAVAVGATALDQSRIGEAILRADPETILAREDLARPALNRGKATFVAHCASCHGVGHGDPTRGIPDLTDHDFLYGSGQVAEIEQIVLHGIRSGDSRGWHLAAMPAYAQPVPYAAEPAIKSLSPGDVADVVEYLLNKNTTDSAAAIRGHAIFTGRGACWDCHEPDGGGNPAVGAPNLNDAIWLYGDSSAATLTATLKHGHAGASPAFARTLSAIEARSVAVYVASLPNKPA